MKKRVYLLTIFLACFIALLLSAVPVSAAEIVNSGTCGADGDNLTWALDSNGVLTISGSGEMKDYEDYTAQPWSDSRKDIKSIRINNGATCIGKSTFCNCSSLRSVKIPNSVMNIGACTFGGWMDRATSTLYEAGALYDVVADATVVELYAKWIPKVAISYYNDSTGMSLLGNVIYVTNGEHITLYAATGLSTGTHVDDTFLGWRCSENDNLYLPGTDYAVSTDNTEIQFVGYWKSDEEATVSKYTVKYFVDQDAYAAAVKAADGGEVKGFGVSTVVSGDSTTMLDPLVAVTALTTEKEGWTFLGWYTSEDDTVLHYANESYTVTNNVNFIGKWTKNEKIHYPQVPLQQNVPEGKYGIMVVDSDGKPISGAKVQWNSETQTTPETGIVFFYKLTVGQPSISVTCNSYEAYSNSGTNYEKNEQGYDVIRLYKTGEKDYKLKSAMYIFGVSKCDVLNGTKRLSTTNSNSSFTLSCRADSDDITGYTLLQNGKVIKTSTDGEFSLNVGNLSVGAGVEVMVTGASGKSVRTSINLELVKDQAQKDLSFKLGGEKVEFTVPEDIPFLGGGKFTVDLPRFKGDLIDFYRDEDTVHLGINCKLNGDDKNSFEENVKEARKLISGLKQVQKYDIGNSLQAKINFMMKNKNQEANIGPIKAKCSFIGYGEGKLDENGLANVKVYLCLILSAEKKIQGPTTVVVCVPVTYSVKVSAEGKLIGEGNWELATGTLSGDVKLIVTPGLEAFGGVGVGKVVGAGAYGSATLPIDIQLLGTTSTIGVNSVDLTGELGLKAYFAILEYKRSFAYKTWHLYTRTKKSSNDALLSSEDTFELAELFDADEYQSADISYLSEESDWLGASEDTASLLSESDDIIDNNKLQALQTGTYRNMQPVLGNADGTPVMVWVKANTERGDYDYPQLVYSVYDGGSWSEPEPVDADNTCDSTPVLYTDTDGKLWLAYQNSSSMTTADEATLAGYAAKQTIVAAYFDKESNSFVDLSTLSSEGVFSRSPVIGEMNGDVTVAWQANSNSEDYFCQNDTNSLCYATYSNGSWGAVSMAGENMNAITEVAVGDTGLYAITDGDNDITTTDGRELKLYGEDGEVSNIDNGTVTAVKFAILPGETSKSLLWSDGESLCQYDGSEKKTVLANGSLSGGYSVLSDRVIYNAADDGGSELFAQVYENGSWCEPVAITQQDRYLQSYSVAEIAGETWLSAVQTAVTITEDDVIDSCDLVWAKLAGVADVKISAVTIDHSSEAAGSDLPVEVDLTNCGDTTIHQVTLSISKDDTQIAEQTVEIELAPGETGTAEISFNLGATVTETNYVVTATVDNDRNADNDSAEFTAGFCDMEVTAELLHIGESSSILAKVTNQGAASSATTLEISGSNGKIASANIESLASGESTYFMVNLSKSLLGGDSDVLTLQLDPAENDFDEINNTSQLYVGLETADSIKIKGKTADSISVEVENKEASRICLAIYSTDGKLLHVFEETIPAKAETAQFPLEGVDLPEEYSVKAFMLSENDWAPTVEASVL